MKLGANNRQVGTFLKTASITALGLAMLWGCGAPTASNTPVAPPATAGGEGVQSAMKGYAAFGSQCVSGFNTDPKAVKLELWSCPLNLPLLELSEPLQPLYFNADCAKKQLTVRSTDRTINVSWELMPDGSFNISQDGLNAKLKDDGSGNSDCVTPLGMDLWGQVDCSVAHGEQPLIRFETVMWLNKKPQSSTRSAAGTACKLPAAKCYFHAVSAISQCS